MNKPREWTFSVPFGLGTDITATGERVGWANITGDYCYLVGASLINAGTLSAHTTNYTSVGLHLVTTAGAHTTELGTLSHAMPAWTTNTMAYVAKDMTLSSAVTVADGEGVNIYYYLVGTNQTFSADACVVLHVREGLP